MDYNQFNSLVRSRQSCRSFDKDKKVEHDVIEKIIDTALLSPSACNSQPWNFIVCENEKAKEVSKYTLGLMLNKFTANASAFIVVVEDKASLLERFGEKFKDHDFVAVDLGIAAAHAVLAAKSLGVESCILGLFNEGKLKELLNVPAKRRIRLVIALGYQTEGYKLRDKDRKTDGVTYLE